MRKLALALGVLIAVAGALAVAPHPADALRYWCWGDPVIGVTAPGQPEQFVNIVVGMPDDMKGTLTAPVEVRVHIPANVEARVVSVSGDFPETVEIVPNLAAWKPGRALRLLVTVTVHSDENFPVRVKVEKQTADGALLADEWEGKANQPLAFIVNLSQDSDGPRALGKRGGEGR